MGGGGGAGVSQNTSSAVMQQRVEAHDSLDHFPTPPWAARALCEHVLIGGGWSRGELAGMTCWEPAAAEGYMVRGLAGYFWQVDASDVHDYGAGYFVNDFLMPGRPLIRDADWIVTNQPFRLVADFIRRGLDIAKVGVAMLVRTAFIEGTARHATLFQPHPPAILAPFVERLPLGKGRYDPKASTATSYCWLVWSKLPHHAGQTVVRWIPPCRSGLERLPEDAA